MKRLQDFWFHVQYNLHPSVYKFTVVEWLVVFCFVGYGAYFLVKALLGIE